MMFDKIQIEPTTKCNLSCKYCLGLKLPDMEVSDDILEKIAGNAKEYVIYGYGEPFLYPNIRKIEELGGKIVVSTNGTLPLSRDVIEIADRVGVSIDVDDTFRKGLRVETAMENLKTLGEKGMAEIVLTSKNTNSIPEFFEKIAQYGVGLLATNVVAPNPEIYREALYFEGSRRNVELVMDLDEKILVEAIRDCSRGGGRALAKYRTLLEEVYSEGYSINLLAIFEFKRRIVRAFEAESVFERVKEIAKDYGVELIAPSFFGDSKSRECPYKNSIFVRADGEVSSCMSFAYTHSEYVNAHWKKVENFTVGNIVHQDIDEIKECLRNFEELREDMENFPWCADCPYVEGCWYAERNLDCYANQPSCSECLYSNGIAKCLLG
ncbi:radical SAM/SPASM domain-containing protein [Archaeoglobus sp.]